ncbi:MAG: hypothetical protein JNK72_25960 [Myxococcales bacterium]|nr:hypothetical protein [Myxococcales bacterium]
MQAPRFVFALALVAALAEMGCQKVIGDSCTLSSDCSLQGDRACDTSQPEGYCTVAACDPNACPDEALCIAFNAHAPRITRRYCMAGCTTDDDCRTPEYRCRRPDAPSCAATGDESLASGQTCDRLVDTVSRAPGFCVPATR